MLMGREMKFPLNVLLEDHHHQHVGADQYTSWIKEKIRVVAEEAREHMGLAKRKQKAAYDRRAMGVPGYEPGDLVWVQNTRIQSGSASKFHRLLKGPYIVQQWVCEADLWFRDRGSSRSRWVVFVSSMKRGILTHSTTTTPSHHIPLDNHVKNFLKICQKFWWKVVFPVLFGA